MRQIFLLLILCFAFCVKAQNIAIKTNGLNWLCATPNAGVEIVTSDKFSVDFSLGGSPLKTKDFSLSNFYVEPNFKYWFSKSLTKSYLAFSPIYLYYDLQFSENKYKGQGVGVGFTYGYDWLITERFNIEAFAGARYVIGKENFFFPSVGLNFIYLIK